MSQYSSNTCNQRNTVIDHEKQFQEDLERAQALSLESLALEKFKLQKLRSEINSIEHACFVKDDKSSTNSVTSETDGCVQTEK